jgi:LmbE family N-acetylglucosaminyl deacetylase
MTSAREFPAACHAGAKGAAVSLAAERLRVSWHVDASRLTRRGRPGFAISPEEVIVDDGPGSARRLLGVFAHPDDEVFCAGGTMARAAEAGAEVMIVSATRGERGQIRDASVATRRTLGTVREGELCAAAAELGVQRVQVLAYADGTLQQHRSSLGAAITDTCGSSIRTRLSPSARTAVRPPGPRRDFRADHQGVPGARPRPQPGPAVVPRRLRSWFSRGSPTTPFPSLWMCVRGRSARSCGTRWSSLTRSLISPVNCFREDSKSVDGERAEAHLRQLAEGELRRRMALPVDTAGFWQSPQLALVAQALCAVGVVDVGVAKQIQCDLDVAVAVRRLGLLAATSQGPGSLPPAPRRRLERLCRSRPNGLVKPSPAPASARAAHITACIVAGGAGGPRHPARCWCEG